jgi:hypothetical protein
MAKVNLTSQYTFDQIYELLKNGYPNYRFEKKSNFLIKCDAGVKGKFNISYFPIYQNLLTIFPSRSFFTQFLAGFTIIGIFIMMAKNINNVDAIEMANYIAQKIENKNATSTKINSNIKLTNCPFCKSPISNDEIICEWCGNQII